MERTRGIGAHAVVRCSYSLQKGRADSVAACQKVPSSSLPCWGLFFPPLLLRPPSSSHTTARRTSCSAQRASVGELTPGRAASNFSVQSRPSASPPPFLHTHLTYPIPTIPTITYTYPLRTVATATRLSSPSSLFYLIRPKPRSTFPTAPSFQKARPAPSHTEHSYFLCSAAWPIWAYYNTSPLATSNTKPNLLVSLALEISQQRLS